MQLAKSWKPGDFTCYITQSLSQIDKAWGSLPLPPLLPSCSPPLLFVFPVESISVAYVGLSVGLQLEPGNLQEATLVEWLSFAQLLSVVNSSFVRDGTSGAPSNPSIHSGIFTGLILCTSWACNEQYCLWTLGWNRALMPRRQHCTAFSLILQRLHSSPSASIRCSEPWQGFDKMS